jgi:hypothetical protein
VNGSPRRKKEAALLPARKRLPFKLIEELVGTWKQGQAIRLFSYN